MISERWLIDVNAIPESATAISADGRLYVAWSAIVNTPIVGAVEVVHGRWDTNGRCINCGGHAPFYSMASTYYKSPYCPNCGAKMDLENKK